MRIYAFAALLAFSVVGLAAEAAKADYPCCGAGQEENEFERTRSFHVIKNSVVFGCDGYHCETNIILQRGIYVKAGCRNGWCQIRSLPLKNVWVLESCLREIGYGPRDEDSEGGDEEYPEDRDERDERGHRDFRRY